MKIIFFLLLTIPAISFCQPVKTQVIKIPGITLQQLIRGFMDAGYAVERSESSMKIIITHARQAKKFNISTIFKAKINEGEVLLSGEYAIHGKEENYTEISNTGNDSNEAKEAFTLLQDFAQSFKKPVVYLSAN